MTGDLPDDTPPPMTPRQMLRLLDKLCEVGCARRQKKRDGQIIYSLSVDDIWEGDAILSGEFWEDNLGGGSDDKNANDVFLLQKDANGV